MTPSPWSFFPDAYATERLKTLSVWSVFRDGDLRFRCAERARTPLEHMVHQCVSEDTWMRDMLGITTPFEALPAQETRIGFLLHYAAASGDRLAQEAEGGAWPTLPGQGEKPATERP